MLKRLLAAAFTAALFSWQAIPAQASDVHFLKAASSSWPSSYTKSVSSPGVSARWVANGDKLYVKDTAADGRRVGAWFLIEGSGAVEGICYNTLGSGKAGLCDLELTEGRTLWIFLVTCDADVSNCNDESQWKVLSYIQTIT